MDGVLPVYYSSCISEREREREREKVTPLGGNCLYDVIFSCSSRRE